jgi:hypothetical protein
MTKMREKNEEKPVGDAVEMKVFKSREDLTGGNGGRMDEKE